MGNKEVRAARIIVDRERIIKETYQKLKDADEQGDLAMLNEGLETSIELGLEGPEIDTAQEVRVRLEAEAKLAAKGTAAVKALRLKAQSENGLGSDADIEPLRQALVAA